MMEQTNTERTSAEKRGSGVGERVSVREGMCVCAREKERKRERGRERGERERERD